MGRLTADRTAARQARGSVATPGPARRPATAHPAGRPAIAHPARRPATARPARGSATAHLPGLAQLAALPAAAFAVHHLRYMLAFGAGAGAALQRTGHSYLHSVVPWIVLGLAVAAGGFLRALGRACAGQRSLPRYTLSLTALWLTCATALIAIFAGQEFLEGLLAAGHPVGLAGIFGTGGWWAIPAALCVALVLAAWFHAARWVLDAVARRAARRPATATLAEPRARWRAPDVRLAALVPLAGGHSDRGPPR